MFNNANKVFGLPLNLNEGNVIDVEFALGFEFENTLKTIDGKLPRRVGKERLRIDVVSEYLNQFFLLIEQEKCALNGIFTASEIQVLLSSNPCSRHWDGRVIDIYMNDSGYDVYESEFFFDENKFMTYPDCLKSDVILIRKLASLTPLQDAALADSLRIFWCDNEYSEYPFDKLGFELSTDD